VGKLTIFSLDFHKLNYILLVRNRAHAVAISLQLDKDPASIPQPESGLRKRLWWSLICQITWLELTTGTPVFY
jgi:chromosomal replication initiation ATPase DnaA